MAASALDAFQTHRPYLFAIAYRMLGSALDAEDIVQETYLRYRSTPPDTIFRPRAYLTTILTRLCVDQLHLARRQREVYVGPWLPEPIATPEDGDAVDPADRVERHETISLAFLTLLEQLQPFERAVLVLREAFEYSYAEIAGCLGKSEAACRQTHLRAKKRLAEHRPRFTPSPEAHRRLLAAFLAAVREGDMDTLTRLLAEDVVLWADGGGKARGAATRPVRGRLAVARFSIGATRRFLPASPCVDLAEVNAAPALIFRDGDRTLLVLSIDVVGQRVQTVRIIANPDKLAHV